MNHFNEADKSKQIIFRCFIQGQSNVQHHVTFRKYVSNLLPFTWQQLAANWVYKGRIDQDVLDPLGQVWDLGVDTRDPGMYPTHIRGPNSPLPPSSLWSQPKVRQNLHNSYLSPLLPHRSSHPRFFLVDTSYDWNNKALISATCKNVWAQFVF